MINYDSITDPKLRQAVEDVDNVFVLYRDGNSDAEIAAELDLAPNYVLNMLLLAQTLAEEDIIAIAMLMLEN